MNDLLAPVEDEEFITTLGEKSEAYVQGLMKTLEERIQKREDEINAFKDKMLAMEEFRKNEAFIRMKEMVAVMTGAAHASEGEVQRIVEK